MHGWRSLLVPKGRLPAWIGVKVDGQGDSLLWPHEENGPRWHVASGGVHAKGRNRWSFGPVGPCGRASRGPDAGCKLDIKTRMKQKTSYVLRCTIRYPDIPISRYPGSETGDDAGPTGRVGPEVVGILMPDISTDSDYCTGPPLDPDMVRRAEDDLRLCLPVSYVDCLLQRNGGTPRRRCFPTSFWTSWSADHCEISGIRGIGGSRGIDSSSDAGSGHLIAEWDYA